MSQHSDKLFEAQFNFLNKHPGYGLPISFQRKDNNNMFFVAGKIIDPQGNEIATRHLLVKIGNQDDMDKAYLDIIAWLNNGFKPTTHQETAKPAAVVQPTAPTEPEPRSQADGRREKTEAPPKNDNHETIPSVENFDAEDVKMIVKHIVEAFKGCGAGKEEVHYLIDWGENHTSARIVVLKEGVKKLGDGFLKSTFDFTESEEGVFTKTVTAGCLQQA